MIDSRKLKIKNTPHETSDDMDQSAVSSNIKLIVSNGAKDGNQGGGIQITKELNKHAYASRRRPPGFQTPNHVANTADNELTELVNVKKIDADVT